MTKLLLGFMGVGKTTVAAQLDEHFLDMDRLIEAKIGMSISAFFPIVVKQPLESLSQIPYRKCWHLIVRLSYQLVEVLSLVRQTEN